MTDLKLLARRIYADTLAAIDIPSTMQRKVRCNGRMITIGDSSFALEKFDDVRCVAIGKAAHAMVDGLQRSLPAETSFSGVVSAPTKSFIMHPGMKSFVGGHPVPNGESVEAARAILELLLSTTPKSLIFFLLSGGGSALCELPLQENINLPDLQEMNRALVNCGASISDINAVRKHLSAVKGGRLATAAGEATKITLAVSDVPPGDESALASGPTLPDPSTLQDVERVSREFALLQKFPNSFQQWILKGKIPETPKANHPAFRNAYFSVLLGMDELFHPAHKAAESAGCVTRCDNTTDDWPVEKAATYLLEQLEQLRDSNPERRVAIIADGEVSCPVLGNGMGGRNAAFVLACVEKIAGRKICVLSGGTDGIDGNSPAAGAVADGDTYARSRDHKLDLHDVVMRSDSYTFFETLGDAIVTGPTGNNLRDLRILIAEAA